MTFLPTEDSELKELVRLAQEGDTEAFGHIYDRFFDVIYRYTAFRLPKDFAEDVTA
jgi:RNA polymerase sigma-70 factor, ECF subfamily